VNIDKTIIGVDETGNAQIKIAMAEDMGRINIKMTGIGDNCFGIQRGKEILSSNICTTEAKEFFNPNTEPLVFDIVLNEDNKTA